jgi:multicomponent Na+:H+ antiporter subunit F
MTEFLLFAALVVLATVAGGLIRVLRGRGDAERMMAAQLLGTGGVTVLLLAGVAAGIAAVLDVALILALLAAFAAIAFVKRGSAAEMPDDAGSAGPGDA